MPAATPFGPGLAPTLDAEAGRTGEMEPGVERLALLCRAPASADMVEEEDEEARRCKRWPLKGLRLERREERAWAATPVEGT